MIYLLLHYARLIFVQVIPWQSYQLQPQNRVQRDTEEEVKVDTDNGEFKQLEEGDSDFESKDTDVEGDIDGDVEGEESCDSPVEQSDLSVNC